MKDLFNKSDFLKGAYIFIGAFIYAIGMNVFIVPMGLYSSGVLGLAQILRTVFEQYLQISFGFDIAGIIQFILNVPLMILAYKTVGKSFIVKTGFCLAMQSILLSLIPVKEIIGDPLTSCIIGGILCGVGTGLTLQSGGSTGGVDIIGMYFTKKSTYSVGAISMIVNIFVFSCAFILMGDIEKIIYTLIFAAISMIALDRMHTQNINSEVLIISKRTDNAIQNAIMHEIRRGVSYWDGYGAYTGEGTRVLYIVVSKYELSQLRKVVAKIDPNAFISVKNGIDLTGNFEKRL